MNILVENMEEEGKKVLIHISCMSKFKRARDEGKRGERMEERKGGEEERREGRG